MEVRLVVEHEHEAERGPRRVRQSVARVFYYTRPRRAPSFASGKKRMRLASSCCRIVRTPFIGACGGVLHRFRERRAGALVVRRVRAMSSRQARRVLRAPYGCITLLLGGHRRVVCRSSLGWCWAQEVDARAPIHARALFSGRISMSELALRSRRRRRRSRARVYGAGSVTDFSALGGRAGGRHASRARPALPAAEYERAYVVGRGV